MIRQPARPAERMDEDGQQDREGDRREHPETDRRKGLLMREVAAEVNVLEHTFFRWMRGERQPSAYALYRLARYFGCTMEDLMEGVEENG